MKFKAFTFSCFLVMIFSCNSNKQEEPQAMKDPQKIVNKALAASGSENIDGKEICFDFRGKEYISVRKNWRYRLERIMVDSVRVIHDVLSNNSFSRSINDTVVSVPDSLVSRYGNSVNSVHYFAHLPYGLNDKAVNKKFLQETVIHNEPYYVLQVTFSEENGGEDFDDIFLYWIHKKTFLVDFLAYEYHVNGGGLRFREAYNERTINGIRFVDYKNYKPESDDITLYQLEEAFKQGKLKLLSTIVLENIYVQPCEQC
jgi:hypothetical protein